MIILGIDPGLAETGWGIVQNSKFKKNLKLVDYGCIKTPVGHDLPRRLLILKQELENILHQHKPDCLAIEQLFFGRNAKTAMIVGLARGVIMVASAEHDVPVFEYQGLTVKLNLSGHGHCPKSKMQSTVRKMLGLRFLPRPQHASDALSVAIYHAVGEKKKEK